MRSWLTKNENIMESSMNSLSYAGRPKAHFLTFVPCYFWSLFRYKKHPIQICFICSQCSRFPQYLHWKSVALKAPSFTRTYLRCSESAVVGPDKSLMFWKRVKISVLSWDCTFFGSSYRHKKTSPSPFCTPRSNTIRCMSIIMLAFQ